MEAWLHVYGGGVIRPLDPSPSEIEIGDIAHSLSQLCRFCGHTKVFYSIAEHSLNVMKRVPQEHKLAALLHDASEAYLTDIPRPIKYGNKFGDEYRDLERRMETAIRLKFKVPTDLHPLIKEADDRMCYTEARDLLNPCFDRWWENGYVSPYEERLGKPLTPEEAKAQFLLAFFSLSTGGHRQS